MFVRYGSGGERSRLFSPRDTEIDDVTFRTCRSNQISRRPGSNVGQPNLVNRKSSIVFYRNVEEGRIPRRSMIRIYCLDSYPSNSRRDELGRFISRD